jgi:hypothetical protein
MITAIKNAVLHRVVKSVLLVSVGFFLGQQGEKFSNNEVEEEDEEKEKERTIRTNRRLVAVSGTLQDGFALRKNLDAEDGLAVFVGYALIRGVKMFFDVKTREGCREYVGRDDDDTNSSSSSRRPPMNPALVLTNDYNDANVYHVFAVTETALCEALCNEPRFLGIAPDCAKIDLFAKETSESVRVAAFGFDYKSNELNNNERYGSMLTVIAYGVPGKFAVEATYGYVNEQGAKVTTFAECSACAFGDEQSQTTRDENIRYSQLKRDINEEKLNELKQKMFFLDESVYGCRSKETPRIIDRASANRAIEYTKLNDSYDGGYLS